MFGAVLNQIGPYSKEPAKARLDLRSSEARFLRRIRAELAAHCGGKPSATQRALIDRAAWLALYLAQLDAKAMKRGTMTDHDARHYLAWNNSYSRTVSQLGLKGAAAPVRTLADHLAKSGPPGGADRG